MTNKFSTCTYGPTRSTLRMALGVNARQWETLARDARTRGLYDVAQAATDRAAQYWARSIAADG
ncbi:hypothetical protein LCGC14_0833260 [marine sediment metagenome]|uniref:Uncharacterized protein n=1 Tax=marine sediment metagenome TaxID=412755 RepID=A0A0F9S007_9ZZZZ